MLCRPQEQRGNDGKERVMPRIEPLDQPQQLADAPRRRLPLRLQSFLEFEQACGTTGELFEKRQNSREDGQVGGSLIDRLDDALHLILVTPGEQQFASTEQNKRARAKAPYQEGNEGHQSACYQESRQQPQARPMQNQRRLSPGGQACQIGAGGHIPAQDCQPFAQVDQPAHFLNGLLTLAQYGGRRRHFEPIRESRLAFAGPSRAEQLEEGSRAKDIEIGAERMIGLQEFLPGNPLPGPAIFEPGNALFVKSTRAAIGSQHATNVIVAEKQKQKARDRHGNQSISELKSAERKPKSNSHKRKGAQRDQPIQASVCLSFWVSPWRAASRCA